MHCRSLVARVEVVSKHDPDRAREILRPKGSRTLRSGCADRCTRDLEGRG